MAKASPDIALRPLAEADADALRALHQGREVLRWWGPMEDGFPWDEPESTRWSIVCDGEVVGMVQHGEEAEPDYRHAWIDIFVGDDWQGRGIGRAALRLVIEHLVSVERHHRMTIDPALDNAAAIRCYEAAGFRRVGVLEAAWRDPWSGEWRDALLMELVRRGV